MSLFGQRSNWIFIRELLGIPGLGLGRESVAELAGLGCTFSAGSIHGGGVFCLIA
ncbi:MAG: hypothetical protein NXI32_09180 [bacterium]|nr:hypothetical protein [bacterium]